MRSPALFLSVMIIVAGCTAKAPVTALQDFQPRPNYLTMGDPAAGRVAFQKLKCDTCHAVAGEPVAAGLSKPGGPQLGSAEASYSPDEIARSIAAPGHSISEKSGPWREDKRSNMMDYSEIITVRQLMDLVAYIRSLPAH
jgi:mono/diheme cytochrome c family protein